MDYFICDRLLQQLRQFIFWENILQ